MITRRALLATTLAGSALASERASTCPAARRLFRPSESDRARMLDRTARIRSLFNEGDMDALVGRYETFVLQLQGSIIAERDQVSALRELRARWGRILTGVSWEHCLTWPEDAILYFVASMELKPFPTDDDLTGLFSCDPPDGHYHFLLKLRFSVDQRSNRLSNQWLSLSIAQTAV